MRWMKRISIMLLTCTGCVSAAMRGGPLERQHEEEYRVWGAVLDAEVGSRQSELDVIVDTLASPMPADARRYDELRNAGYLYGFNQETVQALESADSASLPISMPYLWVSTGAPIIVSPVQRRVAEARANGSLELRLVRIRVSRVAFTPNRETALVEVGYFCGALCGHQQIDVLRRDRSGRWRIVGMTGGVFF
jgi:hypothetical protein